MELIEATLFLLLMAIVMVARVFHQFYPSPHPKIPLQTLGQLMWIRTGALAMLSIRRVPGVGFGFWPQAREWRIGALYYVISVPALAALAWWIHFAKPRIPSGWERTSFLAIATFFGPSAPSMIGMSARNGWVIGLSGLPRPVVPSPDSGSG